VTALSVSDQGLRAHPPCNRVGLGGSFPYRRDELRPPNRGAPATEPAERR
jgi:hypothetical protein